MRHARGGWTAVFFLVSFGAVIAFAAPPSKTPASAGKTAAPAAIPAAIPAACRFPLPPPNHDEFSDPQFDQRMSDFLNPRCYKLLGWTGDREIRNTGPYIEPNSYGTHPSVRVYYSPGIVKWLQEGRKGVIADGEMIIKEMYNPPAYGVTGAAEFSSWTVMVRERLASWDGWYWGYYSPSSGSGGTTGGAAASAVAAREAQIDYPLTGFGQYCINCHASADNFEVTYSSRRNFETDDPLTYLVFQPTMEAPKSATRLTAPLLKLRDPHELKASHPAFALLSAAVEAREANPGWEQLYGPPPQGHTPIKVFPGETLDHVVSGPAPKGAEQFITSDQCLGCHDATQNLAPLTPNMAYPATAGPNDDVYNLSPYGEWRASMMGLAGRDPVFYGQLESELTIHSQKPDLPPFIQNLCFRCHGAMGQRQLHIDQGEKMPFLQEMVYAKTGDPNARYGALAREGVSCTVCHHVAAEGLGKPETFTGQFKVGPANELYGPFPDVQKLPMNNALGITPVHAQQIQSAALCGSCHTVKLPVLNAQGQVVNEIFEQATYLEWLNSVFQNERQPVDSKTARTCQDCHMPQSFAKAGDQPQELAYRIAAIEDDTYPLTDNRAPNSKISLAVRKPFYRHTLYGINLFSLQMFQQFAEPLGIRLKDPMQFFGNPVRGLTTSLQSGLSFAQSATAYVDVSPSVEKDGALETAVTVTNLAGHMLPSGVEFRRAFLQFEVLDSSGNALWTSGGTTPLGVIVDGATGKALPSEFFERQPDGQQAYQPHYEVITRQDQVQIYEELVKDTEGNFTTSFLSLAEEVKDNKLQPRGWSPTGPYAEETRPKGGAAHDPDYADGSGADRLIYRVPLAALGGKAAKVQVTLWYQTIPPYYLTQRFRDSRGADGQRLYEMTRRLELDATPMKNWKLQIASVVRNLG
jgi:hypothetical protein